MTLDDNLTFPPFEEQTARKRRERKQQKVISSGWKTNTLNSICFFAALLLCFAHFEHLQTDADYKFFEIQNISIRLQKDFLAGIVRNGHSISAIMFLLHIVATKLSETRFTFLGLLAVLSWPALFFVHYEQIHHRDYLISRLALSAFTLLISTALLFLPKKPKRKKRPNTFYSAFSVASTPLSQRSRFTQDSSVTDFVLDNSKRMMDFEDDGQSLSSKHSMKIGTSNGIRNRSFLDQSNLLSKSASKKSSAPSLRSFSVCSSTVPSHSFGWREKREETPLKEVNQLIDQLMLYSTDEETAENELDDEAIGRQREMAIGTAAKNEGKTMLSTRAISPGRQRRQGKQQGPFASLTFNPAVRKIAAGHASPFEGGLFGSKAVSLSRAGSSCSSLSISNNSSSPFRHL
ncbi:hypothetical protein niasHT_023904 [Heterodera trifolii]|uniref:Uncharacterized protein n=1 Tax=Heterodera trifolii TaxID=157864 RepID=A0ABD2JCT3_9BILA